MFSWVGVDTLPEDSYKASLDLYKAYKKENHLGLAVSEILWLQTKSLLLFIILAASPLASRALPQEV